MEVTTTQQFEWQRIPLAHSKVLSKLSTSPTLLPEQLASLITAISLAARVSIRASALFVEAILETARYSTSTGLGLTRRALIAAVGSARALHYVNSRLDWSGKDEAGKQANDAFLQVLDKYTNVGIYLIHHTFTLTELFSMSSFYLTLSTIQSGFTAAEASVRLLDSLLGSNETSRALASIITLVKSELSEDYRFTPEERASIRDSGDESNRFGLGNFSNLVGFTALTKALTAWVCLQMVTHRRSLKEMKLRVIFDCTIIKAEDGQGGGGFYGRRRGNVRSKRNSNGKGKEKEIPTSNNSDEVENQEDHGIILTDVRTELELERQQSFNNLLDSSLLSQASSLLSEEQEQQEEIETEEGKISSKNHIVEELELLCGEDSDEDSELPEEVKLALLQIQEREGIELDSDGIVKPVNQVEEHEEDGIEDIEEDIELDEVEIRSSNGFEYDIELKEVTTQVVRTTTIRRRDSKDLLSTSTTPYNTLTPLPENSISSNQIDDDKMDEDEWVEIGPSSSSTSTIINSNPNLASTPRHSRSRNGSLSNNFNSGITEDIEMFDVEVSEIPMAINGRRERKGSLATVTRQDTLEHPEESKQRLQVVLRTMTKKFIRRKSSSSLIPTSQSASSSSSAVQSRSVSPVQFSTATTSTTSSPKVSTSTFRKVLRSPASSPGISNSFFNHQQNNSTSDDLDKASVALELDQINEKNNGSSSSGNKGKNVFKAFGNVLKKVPSASDFSGSGNSIFSKSSRSGTTSPTNGLKSGQRTPTNLRRSNISPLSPITSSTPATSPSTSAPTPILKRTSSTTSFSTTYTQTRTPNVPDDEEVEPKSTNWPHQHLVENLQLFMRYSSGAYGQAFLRILGIGRHDFNYSKANLHVDANNHSFAHHVGVDVEDILLSSFTDTENIGGFSTAKMSPIVNYVAVDHSIQSIVLSCRGSLGLSDILVDLTCSYETISVQHGDPKCSYFVHSGMWASATTLQRGTVHDIIKNALINNPSYGIVLCGHSLGGGVAALLAVLWSCPVASFERHASQYNSVSSKAIVHPPLATHFVTSFASGLPPGRPISCYTFGPPCVASPDLVRYCEGLVISTIHNYDIVPTLSLGVLRDLKTMAMGLYSENGTAEEIVGRVIGLYQKKFISGRTKPHIPIPTSSTTTDSNSNEIPIESGDQSQSTSLSELPEEAKEVGLTDLEMKDGRGGNKALNPSYRDPSLLGPEVSEDVELNDWLWSLVKTMRAGNDNDKLYPPGQVYLIENYTVFVSGETIPEGQDKFTRKEGKRVLLRAVDDVEARFSEPLFGRTMMSDHSPVGYENNVDLLYEAIIRPSDP